MKHWNGFAVFGLVLLSGVVLSGCSSPSRKSYSGPVSGPALFPFGEYRHQIGLTLRAQDRRFNFNGVIRYKEEAIRVIALSPFGTTVFRVDEDRKTGIIQSVVYIEAMKKHEAKLTEYYSVIKLLLTLPRSGERDGLTRMKNDELGRPQEVRVTGTGVGSGTFFVFKHYDSHGIPAEITIEGPTFKVDLEVSGYDL